MAEKYDLSEETAKARSAGVKGFKAHKLLDAKGYAKLGGMQRDGSVAVDRYISYRRGKDIVSLSVFLLKDQPIEAHEFQVIAPLALLDGGKPVAEIRPTATQRRNSRPMAGSRSRICRARLWHSTRRWRRSPLSSKTVIASQRIVRMRSPLAARNDESPKNGGNSHVSSGKARRSGLSPRR